ncbi:regulator [Vibrio agarivorans]|uniref:regulator n=1 Tax=Vibrio agarivorans TaxID=153622 RepID=UPI0022307C5C|nr:regulator [Vibrio agarivorans]
MRYNQMTRNFIFREFKCRLSIEDTAKLCFKSVSTVKKWDKGNDIPKECKRLMRLHSNTVCSYAGEWEQFKIENGRLVLPTGQRLTPNQVLMGAALVEIGGEIELKTSSTVIKTARALQKALRTR